jgi:hypothetical protein
MKHYIARPSQTTTLTISANSPAACNIRLGDGYVSGKGYDTEQYGGEPCLRALVADAESLDMLAAYGYYDAAGLWGIVLNGPVLSDEAIGHERMRDVIYAA